MVEPTLSERLEALSLLQAMTMMLQLMNTILRIQECQGVAYQYKYGGIQYLSICFFLFVKSGSKVALEPPKTRLLYLPGVILVGLLGIMVDVFIITFIAVYKRPYMLFKAWHRLFHYIIGREWPFVETICVSFAGLVILFWPTIVIDVVLASMVSSIFVGAYAGVIAYQEFSVYFGLSYIITFLARYDEYNNDVLDMPNYCCFTRVQYRMKNPPYKDKFTRYFFLKVELLQWSYILFRLTQGSVD